MKQVTPKTAFGPQKTEKQRQEALELSAKRAFEVKEAARILCATPEFKEFRTKYFTRREQIISIFKTLAPEDHASMIRVQVYLEILDELLAIEKSAE